MKIPVTILGATGMIGQHYVSLLHNHPWFSIHTLTHSKGELPYEQAMQGRWQQSTPIPTGYSLTPLDQLKPCKLIFSALPNSIAKKYEPPPGCTMISSASCHRKKSPLIIPEINAHHLDQSSIISKPNCATQSFLLPLAPLHKKATITSLHVTTLQALSGAGNQALVDTMKDNVIPFIEGEEEKLESEPLKILEAQFPISAHCNRVPILHGHLACVSVSFKKEITRADILQLWDQPSPLFLPSAPKKPIIYHDDPYHPQPKFDRDTDRGMCVTVGRLRPCSLFDWRFVALSHNAIRGGAGGGVLIAETLKQRGHFGQT